MQNPSFQPYLPSWTAALAVILSASALSGCSLTLPGARVLVGLAKLGSGNQGSSAVSGSADGQMSGSLPYPYSTSVPAALMGADPDVDRLPYDPVTGWTVFPGLPGTQNGYQRAIYVDSVGGDDANTGLSPAQALRSIGSGSQLVKVLTDPAAQGMSTMVVLKPGSSWSSPEWSLPIGGTQSHPFLLSGSKWPGVDPTLPRPRIVMGLAIYSGQSHVAIEGIEIGSGPKVRRPAGAPTIGIHISVPNGKDYLIEDCVISRFYHNIDISAVVTTQNASGTNVYTYMPIYNVRVRRSYIRGAEGTFIAQSGVGQAAVGLGATRLIGATIEDNIFDYNGTTAGDFTNPVLSTPLNSYGQYNHQAHDIYFDVASGVGTAAENGVFDVRMRRNLFSRAVMSIKGPYTGVLENNVFYSYAFGGVVGTWGAEFSGNVLMDGATGGDAFDTQVDNNHFPNQDPKAVTLFCGNLYYNEPGITPTGGAGYSNYVGNVNLNFENNVIDRFFLGLYPGESQCIGYQFKNNIIQAKKLFAKYDLGCSITASGNQYYSPDGPDYSCDYEFVTGPGAGCQGGFSSMEGFLGETNGTYLNNGAAFPDPTRNIASYLASKGFVVADPASALLQYLSLITAQAQSPRQWNNDLGASSLNAYLLQGHGMASTPSCD